ncbi:MAG: M42 family metallopeptidase [Fimbriimonadia bacterium]|jgi:endoglucanase
MRAESLEFFKSIVNAPSPSGFEEPAARLYREYTSQFAHAVETDVMGNVLAWVNPDAPRKVMLAGHMDEIGFIVRYISDDGMLYFDRIGGHDATVAVGQRVWVHTAKGRVPGVLGRKAIHLIEPDERKKAPDLSDLWVDIGVSKKAQAQKLVSIGDCITYQVEFAPLQGDVATARGFDNKMGAFIVAEALRIVAASRRKPKVAVCAVATVQEEIGLRGAKTSAYGTNADVGLCVDVGHATDYPTVDKKKVGELSLGKGPAICRGANNNAKVVSMLFKAAEAANIPYQIEVAGGGTGTDANAMQVSRAGMAVALISVPIRYMHTPCEVLNLKDVENCAKLMAAFCLAVEPSTDFTPGR